MTTYECTLLRLADWAGVSESRRDELVADVETAVRSGRSDRAREFASVVGLALQMRADRATGGDRLAIMRHGARTGGLVLVVAVAAIGAASFVDRTSPPPLLVAASIVALGALIVASPRRLSGWWIGAMACAAGSAALVGGSVTTLITLTVATGVVPIAMLVLSRHDPRLAVAATVIVLARFGTVDRGDLDVLASGTFDDLLLTLIRILAMLSFVVVAAVTSRIALQRHQRL